MPGMFGLGAMKNLSEMLTIVYKYKKLYERRCQELMKEYDLRMADIDILYYVAHSGQKNLSRDIADMGMSKANVSKSVEKLHRMGFVTLIEDQEDRRCVHITPTSLAEDIICQVALIRKSMGRSLMRGISDQDRAAVARVLKQIDCNMEEELFRTEEKQR